jgi:maleylpyruvate isomerase
MPVEVADPIAAMSASTVAMQHSLTELTDEQAHAPSLLPGWTRGHVLTHVARNADALVNLVTSARTRRHIAMYPSRAERDAAIEAGARRPADDLRGDVAASHQRLVSALNSMGEPDWTQTIRYGADDREGQATLIPELRRSEVEIHHVDLGLGYTLAHWPADFVEPTLDRVAADFDGRADAPPLTLVANDERQWKVRGGGQVVSGPAPALLGWLIGRTDGVGLTTEGELPKRGVWR